MRFHSLSLALTSLTLTLSLSLRAEEPGVTLARLPWMSLMKAQSDSQAVGKSEDVVIEYRIVNTPGGYAVSFRNQGSAPLHFGFWLKGWQAKDEAMTNGRIHLAPGEESSPHLVAVKSQSRPMANLCPVQLIHIAVGQGGQGVFWRE